METQTATGTRNSGNAGSHVSRAIGDVQSAVNHAGGALKAVGNTAAEKVGEAKEYVSNAAQEAYDNAQEKAMSTIKATDNFVRKNPYYSLGIGVGLGLLVGMLLRKKD